MFNNCNSQQVDTCNYQQAKCDVTKACISSLYWVQLARDCQHTPTHDTYGDNTCDDVVIAYIMGKSLPNQAPTSTPLVKELFVNTNYLNFNLEFTPGSSPWFLSPQRMGSTVNVSTVDIPLSLPLTPDPVDYDYAPSFASTTSDLAPDPVFNAVDPSISFVTTTFNLAPDPVDYDHAPDDECYNDGHNIGYDNGYNDGCDYSDN